MTLSNIEINRYLNGYPVDLQDIFLELRSIIIAALHDVGEHITWYGIAYYRQENGGGPQKSGICHLAITEEFVEIGFSHGDSLPDPEEILQDTKKGKRIVQFDDYDHVPWEALEGLVQAGVEADQQSV